MAHTFTCASSAIEKLQEAEYFLFAVAEKNGLEFQFNLNAFLSATRSVTFVLQKSMKRVEGFKTWYQMQQAKMALDAAMVFFLELRNISQKEGPVSYVGGGRLETHRWTYRFAGNRKAVPMSLKNKDVVEACAEHLVKLAKLIREFIEEFPFDSCVVEALTEEGINRLDYSINDIERTLALPIGYLDVAPEIPIADKLQILSREFEAIDRDIVERMAKADFRDHTDQPFLIWPSSSDLTKDIADNIEAGLSSQRDAAIYTIGTRILKLNGMPPDR